MNANGDVDADADANGVADGLANAGADMSQVASLMSNERNQQQMRNKSLAKVTQRAFKDHKWEKQLPPPSLSLPLLLLFLLLSPLLLLLLQRMPNNPPLLDWRRRRRELCEFYIAPLRVELFSHTHVCVCGMRLGTALFDGLILQVAARSRPLKLCASTK